eukprot:GHVU01082390.1.p1 GENE.GHVU01082390.1~~GHVU01082390.1.p1  ORF type:complete len:103 (-),score=9.86 GHVU01082390.1:1117-1425(-)
MITYHIKSEKTSPWEALPARVAQPNDGGSSSAFVVLCRAFPRNHPSSLPIYQFRLCRFPPRGGIERPTMDPKTYNVEVINSSPLADTTILWKDSARGVHAGS